MFSTSKSGAVGPRSDAKASDEGGNSASSGKPKGGRRTRVDPGSEAKKGSAGDDSPKGGAVGGWGAGGDAKGGFFSEASGGQQQQQGGRRKAADVVDDQEDGGEDDEANKCGNPKRRGRNHHHDNDDHDEIMVIPDLDDDMGDQEDDITTKVAAAPRNVVRKLKTLRELDNDIKHVISSVAPGGLDLSLLTSCLVPLDMVVQDEEEDVEWQFEALLQELTQGLNAELGQQQQQVPGLGVAEPKGGDEGGEGGTGGGGRRGGNGMTTQQQQQGGEGGGSSSKAPQVSIRPSRLGALLTEAK